MRISHEAIYQSLYIQGRGALRRELTARLRSVRALRLPRERAHRCHQSDAANLWRFMIDMLKQEVRSQDQNYAS